MVLPVERVILLFLRRSKSWFVTGSIKTKKSVYLWIHVVDEIKALVAVMR